MTLNEIALTITEILTAIAGAYGIAKGWINKFKLTLELKAEEFKTYLQEKIESVVKAVNDIVASSEVKKTTAMKMMKEYVEGKHEKWIAWEHIISAKIEEVVALANAIGHGTDSETKGEI